jgi:hypothetical protein
MFDGPSFWRFIHYFSSHNIGRELLQQLGPFISCKECREEYVPPTNDEDLDLWAKNLHNAVNEKIGLPIINEIDIKSTCDICDNTNISGFPWEFIHNVAENGKENAIDFLKSFDNIYPCDKCRNNFFTENQLQGESCLYWTLRNHKKQHDDANLPPFIYIMDQPVSTNEALNNANKECVDCPS